MGSIITLGVGRLEIDWDKNSYFSNQMLFIKERGEDPSDLIMDMIERFYLQHE